MYCKALGEPRIRQQSWTYELGSCRELRESHDQFELLAAMCVRYSGAAMLLECMLPKIALYLSGLTFVRGPTSGSAAPSGRGNRIARGLGYDDSIILPPFNLCKTSGHISGVAKFMAMSDSFAGCNLPL